MTDTLTASVFVDSPSVPARRGGLLNVATVVDQADGPWQMGTQWESVLCAGIQSYELEACLGMKAGESKTFAGPVFQESLPFIVVEGVACNIFTGGDGQYEATANARLRAHESSEVEYRLGERWGALHVADNDIILNTNAGSIVAATGQAEEWAAAYGGRGIIHATPALATRMAAADLLTYDVDGTLTTMLGTPVAVGYGYVNPAKSVIDGHTPTAGQHWLYVTGWVTLRRGPVATHTARDHAKNEHYALAERVYVPEVDCFVAAALVAVP